MEKKKAIRVFVLVNKRTKVPICYQETFYVYSIKGEAKKACMVTDLIVEGELIIPSKDEP